MSNLDAIHSAVKNAALVARDTKGFIQTLTLTVFIEGAEYHYNVDHSTQQVAHPINHEQLGQGTAAVSELWPTLQQRVPEALKGHSLSQIQSEGKNAASRAARGGGLPAVSYAPAWKRGWWRFDDRGL